ncbi:hypothetical protein TWF569_003170 [Orbilia oligospora]|nr:hypothetical protein TWF569_003170 [Orbilia oligospora]
MRMVCGITTLPFCPSIYQILENRLENGLNLSNAAASGTAKANHLEVNISNSTAFDSLPALPAAVLLANVVHILLEVAIDLRAAGTIESLLLLVVPVSEVVALARWKEVITTWLVLVDLESFGDGLWNGAAIRTPVKGWAHELLVAVVLDEGVDRGMEQEAVSPTRSRALRVTLDELLSWKFNGVKELQIALIVINVGNATDFSDRFDVYNRFNSGNIDRISWLRGGRCLGKGDQSGRENK